MRCHKRSKAETSMEAVTECLLIYANIKPTLQQQKRVRQYRIYTNYIQPFKPPGPKKKDGVVISVLSSEFKSSASWSAWSLQYPVMGPFPNPCSFVSTIGVLWNPRGCCYSILSCNCNIHLTKFIWELQKMISHKKYLSGPGLASKNKCCFFDSVNMNRNHRFWHMPKNWKTAISPKGVYTRSTQPLSSVLVRARTATAPVQC